MKADVSFKSIKDRRALDGVWVEIIMASGRTVSGFAGACSGKNWHVGDDWQWVPSIASVKADYSVKQE